MCKCANINNLVTASTAKGNFLKHHSNNEKTGTYLHPLELSSPSPKSLIPNLPVPIISKTQLITKGMRLTLKSF